MPADNSDGAIDPRAYLTEHGTQLNVLSAGDIKPFREKVNSVYEKWTEIIGEDLIKLAQEDMASVR